MLSCVLMAEERENGLPAENLSSCLYCSLLACMLGQELSIQYQLEYVHKFYSSTIRALMIAIWLGMTL